MLYRSSSLVSAHRRGVVLLVVMALLALFAAVGLSFVFYADGEAFASKIGAQAIVKEMPEVDPEDLAAFFLNQMIYGTNNQYSALRGWDLARSIYGYNPSALNFTPYNGEGRASFAPPTTNDPNLGVPMFNVINYQTFGPGAGAYEVRTPEFYGPSKAIPSATSPNQYTYLQAGTATYRYVGGANAPWTAYDTNSLFLAQVGADGTVYMPSFYRPWLANYASSQTAAKQRYLSLRPDLTWNHDPVNNANNQTVTVGTQTVITSFNTPDSDTPLGPDVKNLEFGPGMLIPGGIPGLGPYYNNDSYWIDMGFPVMTAPNGKRYKALAAPLVMDLSNRLNFWANGNRLAGTAALPSNASNQGFGSSEVNLSRVLGAAIISATETGGKVKIMTASPHGLTAGQAVIINNVPVNGYNGVFPVTSVSPVTSPPTPPYWFTYTDTTKGQKASAGGLALPVSELQQFLNFRYGGVNGTPTTSLPTGPVSPPPTYALTAIAKATWTKLTDLATITTTTPHGLGVGQRVWINKVGNPQYNGLFNIAAVPSTTSFQYYYSPPNNGNLGASAGGTVTLVPNIRPGNFANYVNADALNNATKLGSTPPLLPFTTATAQAVPAKGAHTVRFVPYVPGAVATPFPWALQAGMMVNVDSSPNMESVLVTAANYAVTPPTFTATFKAKHKANVPVTFSPYAGFPTFVPAGWLNAPPGELANNPLLLNLLTPSGLNMPPLPMSHQEALLRYGGTNSPALTAEIFRRMPNTFSNPRSRMMGTLASWDFDRITSAPYINSASPVTTPVYNYASGTYPLLSAALVKAPNFGTAQKPIPYTEFYNAPLPIPWETSPPLPLSPASPPLPDFRSVLSQNLRVDLTRPLTDYPPPAANTGLINTASPQYVRAVADRVQFATDIYHAMVRATGARDPNVLAQAQLKTLTSASPDYQAARWLAQLAVNIVDYIDDDDYMTPFNWNATAALTASTIKGTTITSEYLFGTELPRLVLNEAYAQQQATTASANTVTVVNAPPPVPVPSQVNVWAELLNPFNAYPGGTYPWSPADNGTALLQLTTAASLYPPYIIEIHASGTNLTTALGSVDNPTGNSPAPPLTTPVTLLAKQTTWGNIATTMQVPPANGLPSGGKIETFLIDPVPANPKGTYGATETGAVVTINTVTPHGLAKTDIGKAITISGVATPGYDGTFNIIKIPTAKSFTYAAVATGMAKSGGGTATFVKTDNIAAGNNGFYVIAPSAAQYSTSTQAPNLPATYASTQMSFATASAPFAAASATISPPTGKPAGASHAGATVTIETTGPLPPSLAVGGPVVISGVTTTNAMGAVATTAYNNNYAAGGVVTPPAWTITSIKGNVLTFTVPANVAAVLPTTASGGGTVLAKVALLLRRLANPHLPYNLVTNPYVTVDYLDQVPVNAVPSGTGTTAGIATFGRTQPYAANPAYTAAISPIIGTNGNQTTVPTAIALPNAPQNTFFSQNYNGNIKPAGPPGPFDWLVHLDRPPVNPIELLHVSGFRPHELTQRFVTYNPSTKLPMKFQHYAPWNPFALSPTMPYGTMADPNAMIYRALDQFSTSYMAGTTPGGRRPGLVNLNTMTELEIFQALCDAHDNTPTQYPNPWFTQTDVLTVLSKMATARGAPIGAAPTVEPTPFKSFSAASTLANQVSYNDTWFRPDPASAAGQPVFIPQSAALSPNAHPYWQSSLLQKIYNNVTTTSNVFAIWWTVGYFEVVDESVMPPRLGQEIGRNQNRHIRHRFFAIVDRSGLQLANATAAKAVTLKTTLAVPQMTTMTITQPAVWSKTTNYALNALVSVAAKGVTTSYICIQPNINEAPATQAGYWQPLLQPGMLLEIDTGANAEVVTVLANPAPANDTFTAYFTKSHLAGVPIVWRGNPGPRNPYNPRQDSNVVLHLSVIK